MTAGEAARKVAVNPIQALGRSTLAAVRMPNRDGFVPDPRPDVSP